MPLPIGLNVDAWVRRMRGVLANAQVRDAYVSFLPIADDVDGSRSRHLKCQSVDAVKAATEPREPPVMDITTIGLDLAKTVFQVHGVDASGAVAVRKTLRRSQVPGFFAKLPPCLVGMEACGTSHHWARELSKLGHQVRLMPPAYVQPYVKRGKTAPTMPKRSAKR